MKTWMAGALCMAFLLGVGGGIFAVHLLGQPSSVVVQFASTPASGGIRVYVSGAVKHPGVYPLRAGDRIVDAVEAAGGIADDANTEAVDFAQRIKDEESIHIPAIGEATGAAANTTAGVTTGAGAEKIDLNHANAKLLQSLPGIGTVTADKIVASRQSDGLFAQIDDLVQRKLVSQAKFDKIKDQIEVLP